MLQLTGKTARAVEAVVVVADHLGSPLNSRELSSLLDCPERFLEPMMQKLVRANILVSQRGPGGGYVLARERRRVSLYDILVALEADQEQPGFVSETGKAALSPIFEQLHESRRKQLQEVNLDMLTRRKAVKAATQDFTI